MFFQTISITSACPTLVVKDSYIIYKYVEESVEIISFEIKVCHDINFHLRFTFCAYENVNACAERGEYNISIKF